MAVPRICRVLIGTLLLCVFAFFLYAIAPAQDAVLSACETNVIRIDRSAQDFVAEEDGETLILCDMKNESETAYSLCLSLLFKDAVVGGMYLPDEQLWEISKWEITPEGVIMTGPLGTYTPTMMTLLMEAFPQHKLLILQDIPGSLDDEIVAHAIALLRKENYDTLVPANGHVASGGTDFFLGGKRRAASTGAKIGVHSWAEIDEEGNAISGTSFPRDDEVHDKYLVNLKEVGLTEDFYWFTMKAAPYDGMYYLTEQDMLHFNLVTDRPEELISSHLRH